MQWTDGRYNSRVNHTFITIDAPVFLYLCECDSLTLSMKYNRCIYVRDYL